MGAQPRNVGGGSATPVANNWNQFLNSQLGVSPQQHQAQMLSNAMANNNLMSGSPVGQRMQNRINQQISNSVQPQQQSQTGFQNAFNQALSGQVNDQSGAFGVLQNALQNPSQFNLPTNFGSGFNPASFVQPNRQQLSTNFGQQTTGMVSDLPGQFGTAAQSNFNVMSPLRGVTSGFDGNGVNGLSSTFEALRNSGAPMGFSGASAGSDIALQPGMSIEDAVGRTGSLPFQEILRQRAIADQNARFGAEGAGALGTGAQFANATLNADFAARENEAQFARAMQLMGQDLSERSTGANVGLQNRGQNLQASIANMQGSLQNNAQNAATMQNALNSILGAQMTGRGQDFNLGTTLRGQDLNQLGMGMQQDMFNAGQRNDVQTALMQGTLQNQALGNNWTTTAQQINNNAMQTNNQNEINVANQQNQFNQNNSQLGAQFGMAANQLNSQNQGMNNNFLASLLGLGGQMNQMGNNNLMNALQMLFGSFQQSNALGTPQAQTVMQPSALGQALNFGVGLLGGPMGPVLMGGLQGLLGGGMPQLPSGGPSVGMTPSFPNNPIGSYNPQLPSLPNNQVPVGWR